MLASQCPFCGGLEVHICNTSHGYWFVACDGIIDASAGNLAGPCGAMGPSKVTPDQALAAWNLAGLAAHAERASPPSSEAPAGFAFAPPGAPIPTDDPDADE